MKEITVALAGNPNTGKTCIFNQLVGAKQHVANYPGVTVEKKEGIKKFKDYNIKVIDLPGTYSLTAYSIEEIIARNIIVDEKPDMVINVVDGTNLERNLYLTIQLLEMKIPVIIALNMADEIEKKGYEINVAMFEKILGVPVVKTVGNRGLGINDLLNDIVKIAENEKQINMINISYSREIDEALEKISKLLNEDEELKNEIETKWLALKLLESDKEVKENFLKISSASKIFQIVDKTINHLEKIYDDSVETIIGEKRYGYISGIYKKVVQYKAERRADISEKIDLVLTNRLFGIPVFLVMMYLVFYITFTIGEIPMEWIESGFEWLGGAISSLWSPGSDSHLKSLIVDGIIGGVGGVIVFLPNILILFFGIALLEDTGYMARAAFLMDRSMKWVGLHGKSFIPMLTGFGCSVPGIMATRCLDNKKDRLTTILVLPLMSCGARIPIYALIIPAFFAHRYQAAIMWLIYLIGILLAIISAKILKKTMFKGETSPFVMELPPYRIPTLLSVIIHMWEKAKMYLKKAGTIILGISIILWFMTSYPKPTDEYVEKEMDRIIQQEQIVFEEDTLTTEESIINEITLAYSVSGRLGKNVLGPVLKPLGFDWKLGTAFVGALAAKEVFVSQLGIIYSIGEADEDSPTLRQILRKNYTPLIGFCILLFSLISAPCIATIAITIKETNSVKWGIFQLAGLTVLAYLITMIVYQLGMFLGIGL